MTTAGEIALLTLAGGGILLALTILAEALRARLAPATSPGVETFAARVRSWWAMAVLLALALIAGRWGGSGERLTGTEGPIHRTADR